MSTFKKKKLESDIVAIIDVGSYKIRIAVCKFEIENIKLLGFFEKRQSNTDILNNEIKNLEGLCESIKLAIKKTEEIANVEVNKIAINPVFGSSFFSSKKITHIRKDKYKLIGDPELKNITKKIEKINYISATKKIFDNYIYPASDLEIIVSNISEITIDNELVKEPLQKNGEKMVFNLLNIFLSKNNIELLNYISKYTKKELVKILPEEFCLSKIWEINKEVIIINIGNSSSYITVKDGNNNIIGSIKLGVGINSLVEKISKRSKFSRAEIIKKINRGDFFEKEKKEFLEIYCFLIAINLKEIIGEKIAPNNFFLIGGGSNNGFLSSYIEKFNFSKYIKINQKIKFIIPDIEKIGKIDNVEKILEKSNLNIIAMILTYRDLIKSKTHKTEIFLQKAIKEIINEN